MSPDKNVPVIGISMGDPVGIGPEILVKAFLKKNIHKTCQPVVIGDEGVMTKALELCGADLQLNRFTDFQDLMHDPGTINLLCIPDCPLDSISIKTPGKETGTAMQAYIIKGIELARKNKIQALVTCPITKTAMKLAGSRFHGHTELLSHQTNASDYAMMMAGSRLKVVLVTIHIPLSKVPDKISTQGILDKIVLTDRSLKERFGIANPRLAVAGLNPHAGEAGMFGNEESRIIAPAVELARRQNLDVTGPLPPDTVFYQAVNNKFDAVICMYHDQGLIPFKLIHFRDGVNTTLGLPIIRTSVDHGTAYDIAWKGIADPQSLIEAVKMASLQARNRTIQNALNSDS